MPDVEGFKKEVEDFQALTDLLNRDVKRSPDRRKAIDGRDVTGLEVFTGGMREVLEYMEQHKAQPILTLPDVVKLIDELKSIRRDVELCLSAQVDFVSLMVKNRLWEVTCLQIAQAAFNHIILQGAGELSKMRLPPS